MVKTKSPSKPAAKSASPVASPAGSLSNKFKGKKTYVKIPRKADVRDTMFVLAMAIQMNLWIFWIQRGDGSAGFDHHIRTHLEEPDSELRDEIEFLMVIVRVDQDTGMPIVSDRGYNLRALLISNPSGEVADVRRKCQLVCDWLAHPANNTYKRFYQVPENWDKTPEVGPPLLANATTPRDTFTFLTILHGEEDQFGQTALPNNWANENADTLSNYVPLNEISPLLAQFLHYIQTEP